MKKLLALLVLVSACATAPIKQHYSEAFIKVTNNNWEAAEIYATPYWRIGRVEPNRTEIFHNTGIVNRSVGFIIYIRINSQVWNFMGDKIWIMPGDTVVIDVSNMLQTSSLYKKD